MAVNAHEQTVTRGVVQADVSTGQAWCRLGGNGTLPGWAEAGILALPRIHSIGLMEPLASPK
jgi:hypothetical protein